MIRSLFFTLFIVAAFGLIGCDSETNPSDNGGNNTAGDYFPLTTGSSWVYKTNDGTNATRTVIGDSTINGKTYKYVSTTDTSDAAFRRDGNTIYALFLDETGTGLSEIILLKEAVNATWSYDLVVFGDTIKNSSKTVALLSSKMVLGTTYNSVYQVHTDISGTIFGFPFETSIDQYFAKGVGLIETEDPQDESDEQLVSYDIK